VRSRATALTTPEHNQLVASLLRNELLASATSEATQSVADSGTSRGVAVARNAAGDVLIEAAADSAGRFLLFANVETVSAVSVALLVALQSATTIFANPSESDLVSISDDVLRSLERAPATTTSARTGLELGRWVWVLALVALVAEWFVRRQTQVTRADDDQNASVAA
jgi:hypothetical protein